jgi:hypothetical protein
MQLRLLLQLRNDDLGVGIVSMFIGDECVELGIAERGAGTP